MKRVLFIFFFLLASVSLCQSKSSSDVFVKSYTRSDGTVVKGHYRSAPNYTNRDNFSTKGNTNPYTGKRGYIDPDNNRYKPSSIGNSSTRNFNYTNYNRQQERGIFYGQTPLSSGLYSGVKRNYEDTNSNLLGYLTLNGSADLLIKIYKFDEEISIKANNDIENIKWGNFLAVMSINATDMENENEEYIFIDDGKQKLKGKVIDIILERDIILTFPWSGVDYNTKETYYYLTEAQLKVLSMYDVKEILFRVKRKYIDKKTKRLNDEGKIFNYISKNNFPNSKLLFR